MRFLLLPIVAVALAVPLAHASAQKSSPEAIAKALMPPAPSAEPQERTRSMATRNIMIESKPQAAPRIDLDIEFEFGKATLTEKGRAQLDALAKGMALVRTRSAKAHVYQLVGHTDGAGGEESNLELSRRRAESAREYLVSTWSIKASHIEIEWRGKRELKNAKDPYAAENRRVEVRTLREAIN